MKHVWVGEARRERVERASTEELGKDFVGKTGQEKSKILIFVNVSPFLCSLILALSSTDDVNDLIHSESRQFHSSLRTSPARKLHMLH